MPIHPLHNHLSFGHASNKKKSKTLVICLCNESITQSMKKIEGTERILGLTATRTFGEVGVGLSLDPEGRIRLLVRGSSFALKNRDRSFWI